VDSVVDRRRAVVVVRRSVVLMRIHWRGVYVARQHADVPEGRGDRDQRQEHRHEPCPSPHVVRKYARSEPVSIQQRWQSAAEPVLEEKWFNGRPEWVVTFRHPTPTEKAKQRLYIFLTPTGRFVAANHTGR
jgi:hypothetical protein